MQEEINRVWDYTLYLQLMACFCDEINFDEFNTFSLEFYDFIKNYPANEIEKILPAYEEKLDMYYSIVKEKYPLKVEFRTAAKEWNNIFKSDKEVLSNGILIGWLEKLMDLKNFYSYDYYPYQFRIGLTIHKGRGDIEEHILLKDAFSCLCKAEKNLLRLKNFGTAQKDIFKKAGENKFDAHTLSVLNTIKYEASFYSRLTVISFYSFFECFVNSIGYDIYYRRVNELTETEKEILRGSKKGRYLNLKYKIEAFQKISRSDKTAKIVLSDEQQITEPFKTIFDVYEELRNSVVHHSPDKTKIWIKPDDWFTKAEEFSKLTTEASKMIWQVCHETIKGPDYLGRLDYKSLYNSASKNENQLAKIDKK